MRIITAVSLVICFVVSAILANTQAAQSDELVGRWEQLSLPTSRHSGVSAIGIEPEGTLWVMAQNSAYYWDGKEFRQPINTKLTSGYYLSSLCGGPDRGLYATQTGEHNHTGKVYKLVDGNAIYVTDFYYDVSHARPCFYVSKSGRLFNWGTRFLAVYIDNEWKRIETRLHTRDTLTFDTGEKVYFYYDPFLYSIDRHGNFDKRQISAPIENVPGQKRIHGALWGQDKMLIFDYGSKQVYAYHLDTGEPVDTEPINSYLANRPVYDLFAANDGAVWLLIKDQESRSYEFLRITPEGDITTVKETAQLGWDNTQFRQFPHSVLNASDGSLWLSSSQSGIARYKNGRMQVFGWRQGVNFGLCLYLFEGSQGQIYASSQNGVYVFRPGQPAKPPAWIHQWQEYSSHPVRDSEGNIWMCLEDHPGHISRWDGYRWHHMKVPFDTSRARPFITDDQGHILLSAPGSLPLYDISPYDINQYKNLKDILVAAVARGARRFWMDRFSSTSIVVKGGKIWFGGSTISCFDGEKWDNVTLRIDVEYLYESPKYGILIRTEGGKYYTHDGGQITHVEIPKYAPTRWLLGPQLIQPFEQELLDKYPEEYIPIECAEDGKYYMLVRHESDNTNTSPDGGYRRSDLIGHYITTVTPGFWGGHWSDYLGGGVFRFFGGRAIGCGFQNTPISHIEKRQVLEDRAHNLWIDVGWYSGARHIFMKRLSDFILTADHVPTEAKRSVTINTEAHLAGRPQSNTRLFWRFKESCWHGGERTNSATIYFPADGLYQIEMVAMEPIGGITPEMSFAVNVTVPLPDTILTETGPYTSKDIIWQIPANVVPSEPGQIPHLAYRIDEKGWKPAYKDKMISFQGLEPGEYHIQVAAVEDERYYDTTPPALDVTYAPDYNFIVERRLELIMGDDPNQAQAALAEIKMAGPDVVPVLQQKLAEARKAAQIISFLERLIQEIQRGPLDVEYPRRFEQGLPPPPPPPPPPPIR
jgi:hypothetical protein